MPTQTGVKGLTYEFSGDGVFAFSADVKENANVWAHHYTTPAASVPAEQTRGSNISFGGADVHNLPPNHAGTDTTSGELFSIHTVPDGSFETKHNTGGMQTQGMAYDGQYYWVGTHSPGKVYKFTKSFTQKDFFDVGATANGVAWDGTYLWVASNGGGSMYRFTKDGTEQESFSVGFTPSGVAWDGTYLIVTSGNNEFRRMKASDGSVVTTSGSKGPDIKGCGFNGVYLYVNENVGGNIYRYKNDSSFTFVDQINDTGSSGVGAAWDGQYLLGSNDGNGVLYKFPSSNSLDISYEFAKVT